MQSISQIPSRQEFATKCFRNDTKNIFVFSRSEMATEEIVDNLKSETTVDVNETAINGELVGVHEGLKNG